MGCYGEQKKARTVRAEDTGVLWARSACRGAAGGGSLQGRGGQRKTLDFDGKAPDL